MKRTVLKIFAVLMGAAMLLSGCGFNSGVVIGSVEMGTKTSWNQSHYLLNGTKSHVFSLGKEKQNMEIKIVTDEGTLDLAVTYPNGGMLLEIKDAETGKYEFAAQGRIKIHITGNEHRGSIEVKKAES